MTKSIVDSGEPSVQQDSSASEEARLPGIEHTTEPRTEDIEIANVLNQLGIVFLGEGNIVPRSDHQILAEEIRGFETRCLLEPQEPIPSDDDPCRMYLCRELDGSWVVRDRFSIDNLPYRWHMTWYGAFYAAAILPDTYQSFWDYLNNWFSRYGTYRDVRIRAIRA